ncbi:hypothetical protein TcWFU_008587 [Taenia crassiceps]|uniref:Uncharacterized protein n=1 Tax=Taenia crassiceps TaxID=6207 RepID=A0ABR4QEY2_9CEST
MAYLKKRLGTHVDFSLTSKSLANFSSLTVYSATLAEWASDPSKHRQCAGTPCYFAFLQRRSNVLQSVADFNASL